jgi:hypothetical protein
MDAQDILNHLAGWIQVIVQWVVVPLTMAWLACRWLFLDLDCVTSDQKRIEQLKKRARTGWTTGFLFAVLIFAVVVVPRNPQATTLWQPVAYPQSCFYVAGVAAGALVGFFPRRLWVWIRKKASAPGSRWKRVIDGEPVWSAFLACVLGIFSLLIYFLCYQSQSILFAGFVGLLLGHRLARLTEVPLC